MAINNILFNAAVSGAAGGIQQQRWLTDVNSGNYLDLRNAIVQFATTIDGFIQAGNYTQNDADLLSNLCNAALSNRNLTLANIGSSITGLAQSIVALFNSLQGQLQPTDIPVASQVGYLPGGGVSSNVLTILPAGHRPGVYIVMNELIIRTTGSGNITPTVSFTAPLIGALTIAPGGTGVTSLGQLLLTPRPIVSSGTAPVTIQWSSTATGTPVVDLYPAASLVQPLA